MQQNQVRLKKNQKEEVKRGFTHGLKHVCVSMFVCDSVMTLHQHTRKSDAYERPSEPDLFDIQSQFSPSELLVP